MVFQMVQDCNKMFIIRLQLDDFQNIRSDLSWSILRSGSPVVMVVLGEQGGAVLGVAWPLPSGSASGPWRILNEHFRL